MNAVAELDTVYDRRLCSASGPRGDALASRQCRRTRPGTTISLLLQRSCASSRSASRRRRRVVFASTLCITLKRRPEGRFRKFCRFCEFSAFRYPASGLYPPTRQNGQQRVAFVSPPSRLRSELDFSLILYTIITTIIGTITIIFRR